MAGWNPHGGDHSQVDLDKVPRVPMPETPPRTYRSTRSRLTTEQWARLTPEERQAITANGTRAFQEASARRATDDPVRLARAARIIRHALARQRLTVEDLTSRAADDQAEVALAKLGADDQEAS